jgi:hypothetical protein
MEAWGAFIGRKLAAFATVCRIKDCANILNACSDRKHFSAYPNNALLYTLIKQSLDRPDITAVAYGLESVQNLGSLDSFKVGIGFEKRPIGIRVEVARFLRPLFQAKLGRTVCLLISHPLSKKWKIRKLKGFIRWYAEQPKRK